MAIHNALKKVENLKGASLYLDGHWWMCKPCWDLIIKVGISKAYLRKDSMELYKK
jgi:deoxycytidylate deaminase